jgi:signal transduction histidine kinase
MDSLIDALFRYTTVDEAVTFESVDFAHVVAEAQEVLAQEIAMRGARISHGELPRVQGSAIQLVQLLQNLFGNAMKYCEAERPIVELSARRHDHNDNWMIAVKDNGIGIPEAARQVVFEPFRRLHDRDTYSGTGLGLATCRKIVERHGGEIWCESSPGQGSCFYFTLRPACEPVAADGRHEARG